MMAEDCGVVDIADLLRALADRADEWVGRPEFNGFPSATVTITVIWQDGTQSALTVGLTATRPYFGGFRHWYVCPRCERRAGKLYIAEELRQVGCQACLRLVYATQYRKSWAAQQGRALRQFLDFDFAKEERKSKRLMKVYLAGRVSEKTFWEKGRNPLPSLEEFYP